MTEKVEVSLGRTADGDVLLLNDMPVSIEDAPDLVRSILASLAEFTIARSTSAMNFWQSNVASPPAQHEDRDPPTGLRWHRVDTGNYAATLPSGRTLRVTNDHGRWLALDGDQIIGVASKKRIAQVRAENYLMGVEIATESDAAQERSN